MYNKTPWRREMHQVANGVMWNLDKITSDVCHTGLRQLIDRRIIIMLESVFRLVRDVDITRKV